MVVFDQLGTGLHLGPKSKLSVCLLFTKWSHRALILQINVNVTQVMCKEEQLCLRYKEMVNKKVHILNRLAHTIWHELHLSCN